MPFACQPRKILTDPIHPTAKMDSLLVLIAMLVGVAGAYYFYTEQQKQKAEEAARIAKAKREQEELERQQQLLKKQKPKKVDITAELKKKGASSDTSSEYIDTSHPFFVHALKGHKFAVTAAAYSPNGRFLATASTDRVVRVFLRDALNDHKAKPHLITLEYDHATALNFSSDGRTLVVATQNGLVKLYQKLKVKPELVKEFTSDHKKDVHSILMNDIGQWATIVTCAGDSDTDVKFWDSNGKLLQVVNTNQVANYHCVASKDNRYIAVAAYTPEVKIFEITREKNGMFKKANKIMSLHGHRTGIIDLSFNGSETIPVDRIVTTCKDGSIRLWDINVRYAQMEDPRLIKAFETSEKKALHALDMTPNGKILVAAHDRKLIFISTATGTEYAAIENAFEDAIKRVTFSASGDEVLVQGKSAKHVKLFKTPACP